MSLRSPIGEGAHSDRKARAGLCVAITLLLAGAFVVGCDDEEPTGTLEFGEVCETVTEVVGECISGLCEPTDNGGANKRCTQACDDATPCPSGICDDDGFCLLGPPAPEGTLSVGYIYVGPVGDHGWSKAHDDGRRYLEDQLQDIDVHFSPSIIPPDAPAEIESFVERGDDVIIGTSHDFLSALQAAANNNPDVYFLTCSGFQTGPNLGSYFGRMYQVMYLLGIMAGSVTTTNVIGIVGPVVIPETVRHLNAFTRGVQAANPDAEVVVSWIYNWFSLNTEEQDAVHELVEDYGADIIFGHTDTPIPMTEVVEGQNGDGIRDFPEGTPTVYTIGYDNPDSCTFSEDYCLSSGYWNWGPIVTQLITDIQNGDWLPSQIIWDQIVEDPDESMIYYAPINDALVDSAVIAQVDGLVSTLAEDSEEGRMLPFEGPVLDAMGEERISDGEYPTDEDLLNICWYVDGVTDTDAQPDEVPADCVGDR